MRAPICIFLAVFCLASRAPATEEQREEYLFDWIPGATMRVRTFAGVIRVAPTDESQARLVVYKIPAATEPAAARRWLDETAVTVAQANGTMSVEGRDQGPLLRFTLGPHAEGELRFELYLPQQTRLDLETGRGRIEVGPEWVGDVRARVESGNIALGRIDGDVDASVEVGEIQLSRATGDATLRTSRGSLAVGTVSGRAVLETRSGDIDILRARGGLDARATAGDVKAGFARVLPVASSIVVSGGNLTVAVDPDADLTLEATSFLGRVVASGVSVAPGRKPARRHLVGSLNAGGALLKLHANGGNVMLVGEPEQLAGF
ncbi:MAG TPA: DUF4097 family beta strand repeat-containing protein [Opitutaceae bacterium]